MDHKPQRGTLPSSGTLTPNLTSSSPKPHYTLSISRSSMEVHDSNEDRLDRGKEHVQWGNQGCESGRVDRRDWEGTAVHAPLQGPKCKRPAPGRLTPLVCLGPYPPAHELLLLTATSCPISPTAVAWETHVHHQENGGPGQPLPVAVQTMHFTLVKHC